MTQTPCGPSCDAGYLSLLTPSGRDVLATNWDASRLPDLLNEWTEWGRPEQRAPDGDWRCWLFMGGRGAGKTRAGAEWVSALVRHRQAGRIALIGPTLHDVREVMVEGPSGVRSLPYERPRYEASRKRLVWSNGAHAACFSAEDPDALRGPQFDAAWCDELCFWAHPEKSLQTLEYGLRLGTRSRMMVTTTPRPIRALKRLLDEPDTVVTRSSTFDNAKNLSSSYIAALRERFAGTSRHRQELLGELIEDIEGAMGPAQGQRATVRAPAIMGELQWALWPGPVDRWDEGNVIRISLYAAHLRAPRARMFGMARTLLRSRQTASGRSFRRRNVS